MNCPARSLLRQPRGRAVSLRAALVAGCALVISLGMAPRASQPQERPPPPPLAPPGVEVLPRPADPAPPREGAPPSAEAGAIRIPLGRPPDEDSLRLTHNGERITLVARRAPLSEILSLLAEERNLDIVFGDSLDARVSITLRDALLEDALTAVLSVAGYRWAKSRGIIHVTRADQTNLPAHVQGRQLQVFALDYTAAADMLEAVQGFLSPAGRAYIQESSAIDNRRTREAVVVEDFTDVVQRVAEYVAQIDQPPRQVLIQVHVLQVELKDELKHGVNLDAILRLAKTPIQLESVGFASRDNKTATFLSLHGADLSSLVELLQTTADAKTIASPRVLCLNGQQSRIQVGEQLGFRVVTTTQTSTMESVEFLDLGVVLRVTPRISRDNKVMIQVKPEVSSGRVNPLTGLPEEETTEVETNVLLHDGQAIVIGGLIQELDTDLQAKIPKLGDYWRVGRFFQRRELTKSRTEIIIALVPYVLPYEERMFWRDCDETHRAAAPLLHGPLLRADRPWEPRLPSAFEPPVRLPPICEVYAGPPTRTPPQECVVPPLAEPQPTAVRPGRTQSRVPPGETAANPPRIFSRIGTRLPRLLR